MKQQVKYMAILLAGLLGLMSQFANAALIDQGDSTLDTASGLEWLDVSLTDAMTVSNALATYGADGWALATESQFHTMFDGPDGFFSNYVDTDGNGYESINPETNTELYNQTLTFASLFGTTYVNTTLTDSASYGFYTDEVTGALHLGGVYLGSSWSNIYADYPFDYADGNTSVGIFMVRASSVPEPSTILMLGLGLLGLGFARRKA